MSVVLPSASAWDCASAEACVFASSASAPERAEPKAAPEPGSAGVVV
jgi:hypothetical protein